MARCKCKCKAAAAKRQSPRAQPSGKDTASGRPASSFVAEIAFDLAEWNFNLEEEGQPKAKPKLLAFSAK